MSALKGLDHQAGTDHTDHPSEVCILIHLASAVPLNINLQHTHVILLLLQQYIRDSVLVS